MRRISLAFAFLQGSGRLLSFVTRSLWSAWSQATTAPGPGRWAATARRDGLLRSA